MVRSTAGTKGVPRVDRESQILDVAARAFGTHGYAATSIADIADQAGISKPLVYNYFGSKEGLFLACIQQAGTLLAEEIERVARHDVMGLQRGVNTLAAMFELLEDRRHLWRIVVDPTAPTTGPIADATGAFTARTHRLAREGVAEMLAAAGVTDELDVDAMTRVWLGIVDSLMAWWIEHPHESADQMLLRCERLIASLFAEAGS
ncbi:TetR/AcrR family transcriptional regulator [Aeromicrobium sp. CF3.5]|uniref:TetR/AcrR family transcriptional regulator n=1 Tax=Aeromicrobium sp. CF3.5 TaxID=3373078 RepID=UPI003EE674CC